MVRPLVIITFLASATLFLVVFPLWLELPERINQTYINQASYWLTFFPYVITFSWGAWI